MVALMDSTPDSEECAPSVGEVTLAGGGARADLSLDQLANAATVVEVGNLLGVPRRGIVVALAVASQESRFLNYANDGLGGDLAPDQWGIAASLNLPHQAVGTDHGSLGIFQQQWPWWGSMTDLMDPATAAEKFYDALLEVAGWEGMPVTVAGQAVQRSALPFAYADDEALARSLLGDAEVQSGGVVTAGYQPASECGVCAGCSERRGRWSSRSHLGRRTSTGRTGAAAAVSGRAGTPEPTCPQPAAHRSGPRTGAPWWCARTSPGRGRGWCRSAPESAS